MAHISTLGAGIYSDLSVYVPAAASPLTAPTTPVKATVDALFSGVTAQTATNVTTAASVRIQNVRSFPSIGAPANIVNVATFGSKASKQINGQADSPTIELTLNYIPAEWDPTLILGARVGDGNVYAFRFTLFNTPPTGTTFASSSVGFGAGVQNSYWYWYGKIEALLINPQLTDSNTATLTLSVQSDFAGPYTV
jgi:hypothetical protein